MYNQVLTTGDDLVSSDNNTFLTRRAFATGMTGSLAVLGIADSAPASARTVDVANAVPEDIDLRDAALRGLARAGDSGDPVLATRAEAALARLERSDPEGALLVRIYRAYDVASVAYRSGNLDDDPATADDLAALHMAVQDCCAVSFHYTDQEGTETDRTVLPLALVHPPQGIKLLAWCEKRQDVRQFFVRSVSELNVMAANFRDRRIDLLRHLADSATMRV
jgi:predicted DNA-binding transcriptional regulator YafY